MVFKKGQKCKNWNGFEKGHKHSAGTKRKLSLAKLGDENPAKRPEVRKKISKIMKGKHTSPSTEFKKGQNLGEKNVNWNNGSSFEPYGIAFNNQLKAYIRWMDNHTCQQCGITQNQLNYKLHIHHIDFNKKNNTIQNLISLCRTCHMQTNYNRQDWIKYFQGRQL